MLKERKKKLLGDSSGELRQAGGTERAAKRVRSAMPAHTVPIPMTVAVPLAYACEPVVHVRCVVLPSEGEAEAVQDAISTVEGVWS